MRHNDGKWNSGSVHHDISLKTHMNDSGISVSMRRSVLSTELTQLHSNRLGDRTGARASATMHFALLTLHQTIWTSSGITPCQIDQRRSCSAIAAHNVTSGRLELTAAIRDKDDFAMLTRKHC